MEALRRLDDDGQHSVRELVAALRHRGPGQDRLLAVLGRSVALGDHLVGHPEHWSSVTAAHAAHRGAAPRRAGRRRRPPTGAASGTAYDALRVAYRRELLGIAALDLTAARAVDELPETAAALADLASAALEAALAIAREEVGEAAARCRLAVIGMGKCGGRELNYVSDVDVIFVVEPVGRRRTPDEAAALSAGTQLATSLMRACSTATGEGTLWPVDAALRPEGKNGPLVRTLESHRQYYERWAKTWEFQALLKARPVAGDPELGQAYLDAVRPDGLAGGRPARTSSRTCRRCAAGSSSTCPPAEADRQLKLGPGGLRDVEFSVQLLQLVHGRADESLRSGHDARGARGAERRRLRRPRRRRGARRGLPAAAHARAPDPAVPAAPHPPHAHRRGRPAPAGPRGRAPARRGHARWCRAVAGPGPRGAPDPRAAVLPPAADRRRPAEHRPRRG